MLIAGVGRRGSGAFTRERSCGDADWTLRGGAAGEVGEEGEAGGVETVQLAQQLPHAPAQAARRRAMA